MKLHNDSYLWNIIVLLTTLAYGSLWIWQGVDMTDEGVHLSNAWSMLGNQVNNYDLNWAGWLSMTIGGYWLQLTEAWGLLGARFGWNLSVSLLAWICFLNLRVFMRAQQAFFLTVLVTAALLHRSLNVLDYYNVPAVFLATATGCWIMANRHEATLKQAIGWTVLGGLMHSGALMAKLPLIATLIMPVAPPILRWIYTGKFNRRAWGLSLLSIFTFVLGMGLGWAYLAWRGWTDMYLSFLNSLIQAKDAGYHHSPNTLLWITFGSITKSLVFASTCMGILILTGRLGRVFWPQHPMRRMGLIVVVGIGILLGLRAWVHTAGYHLLTWGSATILAIAYGMPQLFSKEKSAKQHDEVVLFGMAVLCSSLGFLGSNGAVQQAHYTLFLTLGLAFWKLPILLERVGTWHPTLHISQESARLVSMVTLILLAFGGFFVRFSNPYRDAPNRLLLTTEVPHPKFAGIFTTSGRAQSLAELFHQLDTLVYPGEKMLVHQGVGLIHYITDTSPALESPWSTHLPHLLQHELLKTMVAHQQLPRLIVRTVIDTTDRYWGSRSTLVRPNPIVDQHLTPFYDVIWANQHFEIWHYRSENNS